MSTTPEPKDWTDVGALTRADASSILNVEMSQERFFSDARREFIARAIMDMVKLITVAAVVSGFFIQPIPVFIRVGSVVALSGAFALSIVTFPRREAK